MTNSTTESIAVSVIIPVYNSGKYLTSCARGLLSQTLKNIELIFVDDCSTDSSMEILKELEKRFPQKILVVMCEENHGPGGARNIGIQYAKGEYLGFVDSDDEVDSTMFEKMYLSAKTGDYDIVDCGFYDEKNDRAIVYTSDELTGDLDDEKRSKLIVAGGYLWSRIFKRSFWNNQKLIMRECTILEDSEIVTKAFATAKNITNVKEVLYIYKNHADSLSKEVYYKKYVISLYDAMKALYTTVYPLQNYSNLKEAVEYEILQMYCYAMKKLQVTYQQGTHDEIYQMAEMIRSFRLKYISKGYNNRFVQKKIVSEDIQLMQICDDNLKILYPD